MKLLWKPDVDDHDYKAAETYLSLLLDPKRAQIAATILRKVVPVQRRANDILRASRREPLPTNDPGVQRARRKLKHGKPLSPILVVSFEFGSDIADGYHRVSAAYHADPFAMVPMRLAHIPSLSVQSAPSRVPPTRTRTGL